MTARPTLLILSFSPIASDARVLKQVRMLAQDHDVTTCGYGPAVVLDDGSRLEVRDLMGFAEEVQNRW